MATLPKHLTTRWIDLEPRQRPVLITAPVTGNNAQFEWDRMREEYRDAFVGHCLDAVDYIATGRTIGFRTRLLGGQVVGQADFVSRPGTY